MNGVKQLSQTGRNGLAGRGQWAEAPLENLAERSKHQATKGLKNSVGMP